MKKTKKPQGYLLALLLLFPILAPLQAEPVGDGSTNFLEAGAGGERRSRKKERKPLPEYVFKRFYLDLNVGAAFRVGTPEVKGVSSAAYEIFGMFVTPHNASVGKGTRVGLNFGINFNRYVALEISGNYIAYNPNILSTAYRGYIQIFGSAQDRMHLGNV